MTGLVEHGSSFSTARRSSDSVLLFHVSGVAGERVDMLVDEPDVAGETGGQHRVDGVVKPPLGAILFRWTEVAQQ